MRHFAFLALIGAALAGCRDAAAPEPSAAQPQVPAGPSAPRPEGKPLTQVGDLLGEYRVAGIDGRPLEGGLGIAVSIDGPVLSFEPTCAGFVWRLEFEGERLVTTRAGQAAAAPGGPPPPVCAVAVHPEQRRLAHALDAADSATRTPDNGIVLAGGGRSVTLFSQ